MVTSEFKKNKAEEVEVVIAALSAQTWVVELFMS
jgi:hypothetical protein